GRNAAEPCEFGGIERSTDKQRRDRHAAREGADDGAVFRGGIVEIENGALTACPFAVLRNDTGLPRNVLAQMPREQPALEIVAAAGGEADDEGHVAAAIKIRDALGAGGRRERNERNGRKREN